MVSSGFPNSQRARIAPLLPNAASAVRCARQEAVDDRPVPSGIVHALRCGGRRADCAGGGKGGPWAHGIGRTKEKADATPGSTPSATTRAAPCFVNCVLLQTPGNVHDCKVAQRCIEAMPPSAEPVAGKGRDGRELREWLEERGTGPVIPPRKNRKIRYPYDQATYRERDIIERMFCRLKDRRRIATRFECNIENSMAAIACAAALISLAIMSPDPG